MPRVAVASSSAIAAAAGARIADEGGNAVDTAIAAVLVSVVTEPGICALGAGAFLTIGFPDGRAVTVDGYVEMPGRGLPPERFGRGGRDVRVEYGGGVETTVGYGSVATPGALAALGLASRRHGRLPWKELVEPAYEWARDGFPLPAAARSWLGYSGEAIFGWHAESWKAIHHPDGRLLEAGEPVRIEHLAESLRRIADHGPDDFYRGELARRIAGDVEANGGILTLADLEAYRPVERTPVRAPLGAWTVDLNPPPAVGGVTLAACLRLMDDRPRGHWTPEDVAYLARVQEALLRYRHAHLDGAADLATEAERLLDGATLDALRPGARPPAGPSSGATVHTSTVDSAGLACAVTASTGYGSGVMPAGTGIWLNNCLGEAELNRGGFHAAAPGTRLVSNMAPGVARSPAGGVLAIGSPGADRITSALLLVLVNFVNAGMPLHDAVAHARLHVEGSETDGFRAAAEPGLPLDALTLPVRPFESLDMYFGGVGTALWDPGRGFEVAADPRRAGGTAVGGRE